MTKSVPPGRNINDTGPKSLDHYITQANRQNVPFELPVAAFMRASANIMNRHDAARIEQKNSGGRISKMQVLSNQRKWEEEMRDHSAVRHYTHHFTDMRGTNTVKRANIVVKKTT